MKVIAIAAVGRKYELGKNGDLIWRTKADLAHFKEETMGKVLVCGRNTYESMPALVGRTVVVLSRRGTTLKQKQDRWINPVNFSDGWDNICKIAAGRDIVIVGGGTIYAQFAHKVEELLLTRFDKTDPEADTFFPIEAYMHLDEGETLMDKSGVTRYMTSPKNAETYKLIGRMIVIIDGRRVNRRLAFIDKAIAGLSESAGNHSTNSITLHLFNGTSEVIYFESKAAQTEAFDNLIEWLNADATKPFEPMLDLKYEPVFTRQSE